MLSSFETGQHVFKRRGTGHHVVDFVDTLTTIARRQKVGSIRCFLNCPTGPICSSLPICYLGAGSLWFRKAAVFAPSSMLGRKAFATCELHLWTSANPASSLCQESSFQLKLHYWFLILVPFFKLMFFWLTVNYPGCKLNTGELLIRSLEYVDRRESMKIVRPGWARALPLVGNF